MAQVNWEADLTTARERAQGEGKPLFVDLTGAPQ